MQGLLRCENLALGYDGTPVLSGVNLEMGAGQSWFVVGPNGQGKTTLLKAILGLLEPLHGMLVRDPARVSPVRTGYVPQRGELEPHVRTTVAEFVSGGFAGLGWNRARRSENSAWALARTELSALANRDINELSGGQRQRALVARALARRPALLVVDEPTTGLDAAISATLMDLLRRVRAEEGTTLLFVGHDLRLARREATHAVLVANGRARSGPAAEILTQANLRTAYAGLLPGLADPEGP